MQDLDRSIYRGLCRRDPEALETLIRLYSRSLLYTIRCILGGVGTTEDAEEVLGDLFALVWYEIDSYDPGRASLGTWIRMRAKYAALDRRRQLRRRLDSVPLLDGCMASPEKSGPDRAERWDLDEILGTLDREDFELVCRRYFLQDSLGEISAQLGLSVNAVRNRLWRIRRRLARQIGSPSKVADYPEQAIQTTLPAFVSGGAR